MKQELKVYLISGPLGVGKTSVSRELAKRLDNCELICGDTYLEPLLARDDLSWEKQLELALETALALLRKKKNTLSVIDSEANRVRPPLDS